MNRTATGLAAVFVLLMSSVSFGGIIATTGDVVIVDPTSVLPGEQEDNDTIFVFPEQQGAVLSSVVPIDVATPGTVTTSSDLVRGAIDAGTQVNSYFVHFDPVGSPAAGLTTMGSLTFPYEVLGIQVVSDALDAGDGPLGAAAATYPGGVADRGVELNAFGPDFINLAPDRLSVTFLFHADDDLDSIRVITAVPEPSMLLLLSTAALGLVVCMRRRRAK